MFRFGMGELVVILLIVLLLFGAKRLPEISRALGRSIKELKKGAKEIRDDIQEVNKDEEEKKG
ncbi:twin-arginine translocase TatA/TatE family subunit [Candidatus Omnitrophota bacterium]